MTTTVMDDEDEIEQPFDAKKLLKYLQDAGGRDNLTYADDNAAIVVGRAIRALEIPNLEVEVAYSVVRLRLRVKPK
jgi:hypothetical protein